MSTAIQSIGLDEGFGPGAAAEGRGGGSWKRTVWSDAGKSITLEILSPLRKLATVVPRN